SSWHVAMHAEDGIRDRHVTGVQTCAPPIYLRRRAAAQPASYDESSEYLPLHSQPADGDHTPPDLNLVHSDGSEQYSLRQDPATRSEERRVGKERRSEILPRSRQYSGVTRRR